MDLFKASGLELEETKPLGRSRRATVSRVPLLNHKVVTEARKRFTFDPTPQQQIAAGEYARTAASERFGKL